MMGVKEEPKTPSLSIARLILYNLPKQLRIYQMKNNVWIINSLSGFLKYKIFQNLFGVVGGGWVYKQFTQFRFRIRFQTATICLASLYQPTNQCSLSIIPLYSSI